MICKTCGKKLYIASAIIDFYDREIIEYRHINGDHYHCLPEDALPETPSPKCHICGVLTPPHNSCCSASGMPRYFPKIK
jgi:hypothetical protein